ncbi:hypothetical protein DM02DRAFT_611137 [Periconia macrospinosa]|uniref:Mediator of RNA polymerase II transcription subunit 22 n=1 Tax=Periconia macrospinosa TaxID=97972 RepID=A0A2V1E4F6_9PLEO|nr:hypothetical protein DM02DRAFT_611137 [Periconia macrospinosa]
MDPKQRNAAALHKRVDDLVRLFLQHYQSVLQQIGNDDQMSDYSRMAQRELAIKEDSMAIVKAAQDASVLIRDLQELWLFGSLDTLADPADEEVEKAKAVEIAGVVERLARAPPREVGAGAGEGSG